MGSYGRVVIVAGIAAGAAALAAASGGAFTLLSDSFEEPEADALLGQETYYDAAVGASLFEMNGPADVAVDDSGLVYVADAGNARILVFTDLADTVADTAIGGAAGVAADRLAAPAGLAVWQGPETTVLFVSDTASHRILAYLVRSAAFGGAVLPDTSADYVFGQPLFTSAVENNDGAGASIRSEVGLSGPEGLCVLDTGASTFSLFAADRGNARVLRWDLPKASFGSAAGALDTRADVAWGQSDFASCDLDVGPDSLAAPVDVFATVDRLFVAEAVNDRVVVEATGDTRFDAVFGAPDLSTSGEGHSAGGLVSPRALAVSPGGATLAVADDGRILLYADTTGAETTAVDEIGDSDFALPVFSAAATDTRTLVGPVGLAFQGAGRLWVADAGAHRVTAFDAVAAGASSSILVQGLAEAPSAAPVVVPVSPAAGDSFVQVSLFGGGISGAPIAAADASGLGADYTLLVPLGDGRGRDTATLYVWTSLETGTLFVGLRSDTAALSPSLLPMGLRSGTETALEALRATALSVEFGDSAAALLGSTSTTSDVSGFYALAVRYDLSETTAARFHALGFDTAAGSGDFRFWIADAWAQRWRLAAPAAAAVEAGGGSLRISVGPIGTDLPGALGGADEDVSSLGGGACLAEALLPRALLSPLRRARDLLLYGLAGRLLAAAYY